MYTKHNLATDIVDLFDEFLASKGIEVPCSDIEEESVRHEDDNHACLYGMEFWGLVDRIEEMLENAERM